jgi:uncharacterized protein (DUF1015 family)
MAHIIPFKAIRPVRDKVHLVASRPYFTYKRNVLMAKLEDNPFTFLHIIHPERPGEQTTEPNSTERFVHIKQKFEGFLKDGILVQDEEPHFYIYRQTHVNSIFTGIIAGASLDEYDSDHIKKHEATLTSREHLFTHYLDITGFNAEPVLLAYPSNEGIRVLLEKSTSSRPEYEFTTTDCIKHELWLASVEQVEEIKASFDSINALYIADGHHRSASSSRLRKVRDEKNEHSGMNENFFLSFLIDEQQLNIVEFNRIVKGLNGYSIQEFLGKLSLIGTITELTSAEKPSKEHHITMYLQGKWYLFELNTESISTMDPVGRLDAELLTREILTPILGINDLKTDSRIDFISGVEGLSKVKEAIDHKGFDVGFVLFPVTMDQVKAVADEHLIMPPKSTWVEPKLRSGLTIYNINE